MVVGRGVVDGYLAAEEVVSLLTRGLERLPLDGKRVLVLIPDGTRTMPVPLAFDTLERRLAPRTAALDYLVALGTHPPMSDAQLSRLVGRTVADGFAGSARVFNHQWDDPAALVQLGSIPARDILALTGGRLREQVPVALNRLVVEYDHVLICGPVFPHEVAGFSGGTKYLFPGIAAPAIIHFTHWLGALMTNYAIVGTLETPVRAVIDRAASLLDTPVSLVAFVVTHEGTTGVFCGDTQEAWRQAAALSARRHIVWVERPFDRVLSIMPPMYDDLWVAGKGMYKVEPVVADGGEVIILAPHVVEVSHVHGAMIEEIGYHCCDYFVAQWNRFSRFPGGILAHSTHVKGLGTFDRESGRESGRVRVSLATAITEERCARINLGYTNPADIDPSEWPTTLDERTLMVPRAGELLFRVGAPPASAALNEDAARL